MRRRTGSRERNLFGLRRETQTLNFFTHMQLRGRRKTILRV